MPISRARNAARMRQYRAGNKAFDAEVKERVMPQLAQAMARRGITADQLLDEWAAIAMGQVMEPLNWASKVKALSEVSARVWPVPRGEPEKAPGPVTNNTLVLSGLTVEQLRALLRGEIMPQLQEGADKE